MGSDLRLDIGKSGQAHAHGGQGFEIRFLAPGRLRDVRFSGRAYDTAWEEADGVTIARLRAGGSCSLTVKVV